MPSSLPQVMWLPENWVLWAGIPQNVFCVAEKPLSKVCKLWMPGSKQLQMKKTVRNAMPTIEKIPFVSREKPGPHPFSKYSFSNITEKIGHSTCSQPVDWTNSILIFPFRGCNDPFLLLLNVPQILKTGVHLQFQKTSDWPI